MAAGQAHPQVNPPIAGLDAVLADMLVRPYNLDRIKVGAL
jgi:hypothetical protein